MIKNARTSDVEKNTCQNTVAMVGIALIIKKVIDVSAPRLPRPSSVKNVMRLETTMARTFLKWSLEILIYK